MSEPEIKEDFSGRIEVNGVKVVSADPNNVEEAQEPQNESQQNQQNQSQQSQEPQEPQAPQQRENSYQRIQNQSHQPQHFPHFGYPQQRGHDEGEGILAQLMQNKKIIIALIVLIVAGFLYWKFYM